MSARPSSTRSGSPSPLSRSTPSTSRDKRSLPSSQNGRKGKLVLVHYTYVRLPDGLSLIRTTHWSPHVRGYRVSMPSLSITEFYDLVYVICEIWILGKSYVDVYIYEIDEIEQGQRFTAFLAELYCILTCEAVINYSKTVG